MKNRTLRPPQMLLALIVAAAIVVVAERQYWGLLERLAQIGLFTTMPES